MKEHEIEQFIEWSQKIGAFKHENIDLKFISSECGIGGILTSDIEASEENQVDLLSIPLENCLNVRNMNQEFKDLILELIKTSDEDENNENELSAQWKGTNMFENGLIVFYLFLIYELHVEKEKSRYFPYLNLLPKEFTTALYFDEDEMAELRSTNLYKSVQSIRQNLKHIYETKVNYLIEKFPQKFDRQVFSYEKLMWAFSAVWSRVFPIEYSAENGVGVEIVPTLLPTVDILNHKFNAKITYFTGSDRRFYLKTREPLKCGDYVCNNYGGKSNDSFLLSYGFVIPNNTEDTLYVQFGIADDGNEELVQFKKKYLEDNSLKLGFYLKKQQLPEDMLDSIRVCMMTEDDFYIAKQSDIHHHRQESINSVYRFSVKNEFKTLHTLRSLFISKRRLFPTTIEEDEEELSQETNFNMQNILTYRIGQKKIIENALQCVDEKLSSLIGKYTILLDNNTANSQENILTLLKNIFIENGGKLSVEMRPELNSFHVITTESISKGEILLIVKSEELIDVDNALDSPFGEVYTEAREEELSTNLDDEMAVIFYIMFEMFSSENSKLKSNNHKKFFNHILKHYNFQETPFLSENLQNELSGTNALDLMQRTREGLSEVFEDIKNALTQSGLQDDENVMTFENFLVAYSVFDLFTIGSETVLPIPAIAQLGSLVVEFDDGNLVVKSLIDIPKDKIITFSALSLTKPIEDLLMYNIYPIDTELAITNNLKHAVGIDMESLESLVTQEKLDILNSTSNLSFTHYLVSGRQCSLLPSQLGVLLSPDGISTMDATVLLNVNHIITAMVENFSSAFAENEPEGEQSSTMLFIAKYRNECKKLVSSLVTLD